MYSAIRIRERNEHLWPAFSGNQLPAGGGGTDPPPARGDWPMAAKG